MVKHCTVATYATNAASKRRIVSAARMGPSADSLGESPLGGGKSGSSGNKIPTDRIIKKIRLARQPSQYVYGMYHAHASYRTEWRIYTW